MFIRTAHKIAWRELRAAPAKFLFVIIAVAVGVAALTGIRSFGFAFKGMLLKNARQLIAADLQAQTWDMPAPEQTRQLEELSGRYGTVTQITETVSMAASDRQRIPQLVSVKAVDPRLYPFYGTLSVRPAEKLAALLPDDESVVVTPELLLRLKVQPGGAVRIGGKAFVIKGTLAAEPDRLASGFGPGMRVLMTRAGLERTGLMQFGSRAAQRFLFRLKPGVDLEQLKADIHHVVPRIFISDYRAGSPFVGKAVDNTTTFLSLISLIALIVGSLGVAMAMHSHLRQRMDSIGIMKAVGARSRQVMQIYLVQTVWLGLAGSAVGVAVGLLVQRSFPILIQRLFAQLPAVPWDWSFLLQGFTVGVFATVLFAAAPLLGIRGIRPNLIFRRNMTEPAAAGKRWRKRLAVLGGVIPVLIGFTVIAAWVSGSVRMGFYFMGGLAATVLVLSVVAALLLRGMRIVVRQAGTRLPPLWRHGFANLYRPGNQATAVLVALGVGVMFTLTTWLLQRTVLQEVTSEGPAREGNVFLLDVRNASAVSKLVEAQPGVSGKVQLVGYIVAKLLADNGVSADNLALSPERKNRLGALRITTAAALPDSLHVQQGQWWSANAADPQLAVSEEAAHEYQLKLGDTLQFRIAGRTVSSPLAAIFRRDSRGPVRYDLVFPTRALSGLPVVYYGAVHAEPERIPSLEEALFEQFPTVTVMNLADILKRIQEAVDQVSVVVQFLAFFSIAAGVIILSSAVAGTRYLRMREVAVLKTLGATRARIRAIFSVEFSILGAVAGAVGGLLANVFTRILAQKFIDVPFAFDWTANLTVIAATALLANAAGWLASAQILNHRPLEVLREE